MPNIHKAIRPTPLSGHLRSVALVLVLVLGALVVLGFQWDATTAGAPAVSRAKDPVTVLPPQSRAVVSTKDAPPVAIKIPAIKVSADVINLGLNEDKTVEVPENPAEVGWYSKGPKPGEFGSAVMLGHLDSKTGPAVFYKLRSLEPGQKITVRRADDSIGHFEVVKVATYKNEDFPASKVYGGSPDWPALNLVTCGGEYDRKAGGYQSNVVVYAQYLRGNTAKPTPQAP
jgi:sortase (surface protein transpeptidase)